MDQFRAGRLALGFSGAARRARPLLHFIESRLVSLMGRHLVSSMPVMLEGHPAAGALHPGPHGPSHDTAETTRRSVSMLIVMPMLCA
jgi:hypothetical protein